MKHYIFRPPEANRCEYACERLPTSYVETLIPHLESVLAGQDTPKPVLIEADSAREVQRLHQASGLPPLNRFDAIDLERMIAYEDLRAEIEVHGGCERTLGTFEVRGDLHVTDPCYSVGTWCAAWNLPAVPGRWSALVHLVLSDFGVVPGRIVARSDEVPGEALGSLEILEQLIGVDSATAGVFDSTGYVPTHDDAERQKKVFDVAFGDRNVVHVLSAGVLEDGCACQSGDGDGGYTARVRKVDGKVAWVEIDFFPEEDPVDGGDA